MIPATNKRFEELPEKQQKFIDEYIRTGDDCDSYLVAGYKGVGRALRANARTLRIKLRHIIKDRIDQKIGTGAMLALSVIQDLMMHSKSDSVRLQAAQDYLKRAGYDVPTEIKVNNQNVEKSTADIDARILELLNRVKSGEPESGGETGATGAVAGEGSAPTIQ